MLVTVIRFELADSLFSSISSRSVIETIVDLLSLSYLKASDLYGYIRTQAL